MCYPNRRKDTNRHGHVMNFLRCLNSNGQSLSNELVIEEEKIKMDAKEVKLFSFSSCCTYRVSKHNVIQEME